MTEFKVGQLVEVLAGPLQARQGYISAIGTTYVNRSLDTHERVPSGAYDVDFLSEKDGGWRVLTFTIHGDLLRLVVFDKKAVRDDVFGTVY